MNSVGLWWLTGEILSLSILVDDMRKRDDMYPSYRAVWIFVVILLNVIGLLLYAVITESKIFSGRKK